MIVSGKFEGRTWQERMIGVFGAWDKTQMLEPLCFIPGEFEVKKKLMVSLFNRRWKKGVRLRSKDAFGTWMGNRKVYKT